MMRVLVCFVLPLAAVYPLQALEITEQDNPSLERLKEVLLSGSLRGRMAAADRLAKDGSKEAVDVLLQGMADKFAAYIATRFLLEAVEENPDGWTQKILPGLSHRHWRVRMLSAWILGRLADKTSSNKLVRLLNDRNHNVRIYSAQALRTCAGKDAVPALLEAVKDDHPLVRLHAAAALGTAGDGKAVPALIRALDDPDAAINAAKSLGMLGGKEAEKALLRAIETPRRKLAWTAIEALGRCAAGDASVLMLRKLSAESDNPRTRVEAARAVREIQGRARP